MSWNPNRQNLYKVQLNNLSFLSLVAVIVTAQILGKLYFFLSKEIHWSAESKNRNVAHNNSNNGNYELWEYLESNFAVFFTFYQFDLVDALFLQHFAILAICFNDALCSYSTAHCDAPRSCGMGKVLLPPNGAFLRAYLFFVYVLLFSLFSACTRKKIN